MSVVSYISDRLHNLVSAMGTDRDKAAHSSYSFVPIGRDEIVRAYRSAWLPRKIVDIVPMDMVRQWRSWQAEPDQITEIEAEEKRLDIRRKMKRAMTLARLFGGSAIYLGTNDQDPQNPLDMNRIGKGGLRFITIMDRDEITPGPRMTDPEAEGYGEPEYWMLENGARVHPSRLVILRGNELPDDDMADDSGSTWGDSIFQAILNECRNADATVGNIASIIFELKVDVIKLPDFMRNLGDTGYREKVLERLRLAATAKGINGTLVLDKEEEYEQKTIGTQNLDKLIMTMMQVCCGAADIPMTRLLGTSPQGMNSSGEHELKNYYDRVKSEQEVSLSPAMHTMDECIIRSAIGSRPPEVFYKWSSLWQPSAAEQAEINLKASQTIQNIANTQLVPDEPLAVASINMLTELGAMPGLESAVNEYTSGNPAQLDLDRDDPERDAANGINQEDDD